MKRLLCFGGTVALAAFAGSCTQANGFLLNAGVAAITGQMCVVPSAITGGAQSSGAYDLTLGNATPPYILPVVVENDLAPAPNPNLSTETDANDLVISGVTSVITASSGQAIDTVQAPVGGPIVSANGGSAGVALRIISPTGIATLNGLVAKGDVDVLATVTIQAKFADGTQVDSEPISYPIHVCKGCLMQIAGACPVTTGTVLPGDPCNPSQDQPVTCCTMGGAAICPAPKM